MCVCMCGKLTAILIPACRDEAVSPEALIIRGLCIVTFTPPDFSPVLYMIHSQLICLPGTECGLNGFKMSAWNLLQSQAPSEGLYA